MSESCKGRFAVDLMIYADDCQTCFNGNTRHDRINNQILCIGFFIRRGLKFILKYYCLSRKIF